MVWYVNPQELMTQSTQILPDHTMSADEKLNAIVRGSLLLGLILYLVRQNVLFLIVPVVIAIVFTYTVNPDDFMIADITIVEKFDECVQPTLENPMMNNLPFDDPDRAPACKITNPDIVDQVNESLESNTFRDVADIYDTNNAKRQFCTNPSTSGDQREYEDYKKFVYSVSATCKDDPHQCYKSIYEDVRVQRSPTV